MTKAGEELINAATEALEFVKRPNASPHGEHHDAPEFTTLFPNDAKSTLGCHPLTVVPRHPEYDTSETFSEISSPLNSEHVQD